MKDPAFLFYSSSFLVGTMTMSFEDKGKYITILSYMHENGRLSEETIRLLVGSVSDTLRLKFLQDETGAWYNERLEIEIEKRQKFNESRKENGKKGGRPAKNNDKSKITYAKPTDNLPINININENIVKEVVSYLNKKSEKNFKSESSKTVKSIEARVKEGYKLEDFKKVVEVKCLKWKNDPKMCDYLRPETLFGSKFESYLNESIVVPHQSRQGAASNGMVY